MPIIETSSGAIDTIRWGTGNDGHLILLHASSTGPGSLRKLATFFIEAGWTATAPAFVGYGSTKLRPAYSNDRIAANVAVAAAAYEEKQGSRRLLFGHSMGGLYALLYALKAQQAGQPVDALILYEPILMDLLDPTDPEQATARKWDQEIVGRLLDHMLSGQAERGVRAFIEGWNETEWSGLPKAARQHLIGMADNLVAECLAVTWLKLDTPALSRLQTPTLLLQGDRSPAPIGLINQQVVALLPNATAQTIEGCGHMGPLLNPAPIAKAVQDFVSAQGAARYSASNYP